MLIPVLPPGVPYRSLASNNGNLPLFLYDRISVLYVVKLMTGFHYFAVEFMTKSSLLVQFFHIFGVYRVTLDH